MSVNAKINEKCINLCLFRIIFETMIKFSALTSPETIRTPFYYYDVELLKKTLSLVKSLSKQYGIICHYAVKANAEPQILSYISSLGFGADCVSGNEVSASVKCGFSPETVMFAGVGKTDEEIRTALSLGIGCFNVESVPELEAIDAIATEMNRIAPVAFRINPNVDAHTHKKVTTGLNENKFGISEFEFENAIAALKQCKSVEFKGLQCHVGSQILEVEEVYELECQKMKEFAEWFEQRGIEVENIDLGGGLGIDYEDPDANPIADFELWFKTIRKVFGTESKYRLHVEPGRSLVASCGSLISRVVYVKQGRQKAFAIIDAGMNDLIRPALYGSYHKIENMSAYWQRKDSNMKKYDVVGPICESSDVWGEGRALPNTVRGDLIVLRCAGAYGQVMSSRYNLRDLAPAVYSEEL